MQLEGKVILVTGAASGLGAATAIACACEGADIYMVDRDAKGMETTGARIAELGRRSAGFQADLSQRQPCLASVAAATEHFGRLDGLCNKPASLFSIASAMSPKLTGTSPWQSP